MESKDTELVIEEPKKKQKKSKKRLFEVTDFEGVLKIIEGNGWYNMFITIIISILAMDICMDLQSILFMNYTPPFFCVDPYITNLTNSNNESLSDYGTVTWKKTEGYKHPETHQCLGDINIYGQNGSHRVIKDYKCKNWKFDLAHSQMLRTTVQDFMKVCDARQDLVTSEVLFFAGASVGNFLSAAGDYIGRRPMILICAIWSAVFSFFLPLVNAYWQILVIRLMKGFAYGMMYQGVSLVLEFIQVKKRAVYGNNYWSMWIFGYMLSSGLAVLTRDWRTLRFTYYFLFGVYATYYFLLFESPRWLALNGKTKEFMQTVARIAKHNKAHPEAQNPETYKNISIEKEEKLSMIYCFKTPRVRNRLLIMTYGQTVIALSYFALSINASFIVTNIFLNVFISAWIEVPTGPFGWFLSERFGRKFTAPMLLCSTICLFISTFTPDKRTITHIVVRAMFAILGKFFLTTSYTMYDVYISEVFPTQVRFNCIFFAFSMSSVGTVIAPYINDLGKTFWEPFPSFLFGCMEASLAYIIWFHLPETLGRPMMQLVSEMYEEGNFKVGWRRQVDVVNPEINIEKKEKIK